MGQLRAQRHRRDHLRDAQGGTGPGVEMEWGRVGRETGYLKCLAAWCPARTGKRDPEQPLSGVQPCAALTPGPAPVLLTQGMLPTSTFRKKKLNAQTPSTERNLGRQNLPRAFSAQMLLSLSSLTVD